MSVCAMTQNAIALLSPVDVINLSVCGVVLFIFLLLALESSQ
jgi:hypothetical protein